MTHNTSSSGPETVLEEVFAPTISLPVLATVSARSNLKVHYSHTKPWIVWAIAVEDAGIDWCTPHCLRHTGITEAVHVDGADVVDISRLVGHRNLNTTQGYIHVADDRLHDAVAKMPQLQ